MAQKKLDARLWIAIGTVVIGLISQAIYLGYVIGGLETRLSMSIDNIKERIVDHEKRVRNLEKNSFLVRRMPHGKSKSYTK